MNARLLISVKATRKVPWLWSPSLKSLYVAILLANASSAAPLPLSLDLPDWLHKNFVPRKGDGTLESEIQCYSLPYGAIGFASHILTYWTVVWLGLGYRPWNPSKRLTHNWFDFLLGLVSLLACVPLAAFTIVRCQTRWQFLLIAVWKTTLSFTLAVVGLHQSLRVRRDRASRTLLWWIIIYALGTVVGLVGVLSIVIKTFWTDSHIRLITYVFAGIAGTLGLLSGVIGCWFSLDEFNSKKSKSIGSPILGIAGTAFMSAFIFGLLAAFYSDWILAAIAGSWSGSPTSDNKWLFWSYFAAKRLPLLSS